MSQTTTRDALALIIHHEAGDNDVVAETIGVMDHADRGRLITRLLALPHLRATVHTDAPDTAQWAARLMTSLEQHGLD